MALGSNRGQDLTMASGGITGYSHWALMPQHRGMLEQWAGEGEWAGEHPHIGKGEGEDRYGAGGRVTGKWDIMGWGW